MKFLTFLLLKNILLVRKTMKKTTLAIMIIFYFIICNACKKKYTYLNAKVLAKISLKDPLKAIGNLYSKTRQKRYSFAPNTVKACFDYNDNKLLVADGHTNRVLKFSNTSNLALLIYSKEKFNNSFYKNPQVAPKTKVPGHVKVVKHEIVAPGVIISDADGNIYIETNKSGNANALPYHYILKFDSDGKFLYKIGQDGKDGLNFPNNELITSLYTDSSKNLYVISRYKSEQENEYKPYGIVIKVYNSNGKFLFKIRSHMLYPRIEKAKDEIIILENMVPAPSFNSFVFSIAFYKKEDKTERSTPPKLIRKELYKIDYVSNKIEKIRKFPEKELSLLAVTNSGKIYLNTAKSKNLDVVIIDGNGKILKRNRVEFFRGESQFLTYGITPAGKIIGVFFDGMNINFIGWL